MKKKYLIVGAVALFVLFLLIPSSPPEKKEVSSNQAAPEQAQSKYKYEVLSRKEDGVDEHISVLIDPGESDPQGLASEIQNDCKKKCNIDIYDDKKAFGLNDQYDKMMNSPDTQPSDLQEWKEKNYVFVAEHLVGTIGYSYGPYNDYPFKDWYYEELKAEE